MSGTPAADGKHVWHDPYERKGYRQYVLFSWPSAMP